MRTFLNFRYSEKRKGAIKCIKNDMKTTERALISSYSGLQGVLSLLALFLSQHDKVYADVNDAVNTSY